MGRTKSHHRRGPWERQAPDDSPRCCGCGGPLDFSQPDDRIPGQLLGTCTNPACREWSCWTSIEGRLTVARRITADERSGPAWTPARPAVADTARRA